MNRIAAVVMLVGLVAAGGARISALPVSPPPPRAFAAALAVPSPGDVSYGLARVRIAAGPRPLRLSDPAVAAGDLVYAGQIGGLAIAVHARDGGALRADTRVYVAVSRVAGQDAAVRDVALLVVRRRTSGPARVRLARGEGFVFSVANATPVLGSFWVRGIDRRGLSRIFAVRNMLATAVSNWGRYLRVLAAADALAAAARPLDVALPARRPRARQRGGAQAIWTGGQRSTRRERAIFRLLLDALGNPLEYAAVKRSPLIAEFIAHDLDNPSLARRWRRVTTRLPLQVPDRYAAAAQEEAQFTPVPAPRISRTMVEMGDGTNSSSQMGADDSAPWRSLAVRTSGTGQGIVEGREYVTGPNIDCGPQCGATFLSGATSETLTESADKGSAFAGWSGCDEILTSGACRLEVGRVDRTVTASFNLANSIQVILVGPGRAYAGIQSDPHALSWACDVNTFQCLGVFRPGQEVTLQEDEFGAANFVAWSGCDDTGYDYIHRYQTCDVLVPLTGRQVTATIGLGGTTGPVITRVAGTGAPCQSPPSCSDGGAATSAGLAFPGGVAVDDAGRLYIADTFDQEVRKVEVDGTITRIAGTGTPCSTTTCGDGGPATSAQLSNPAGVALDANGSVYIADTGDHEIRKIAPDGTITRFAGDGNYCANPPDCGDGGPATGARLTRPTALAIDFDGNVYIADSGDSEVRRVAPDGTITRIAGTGHVCATAPACGDGGPATSARLTSPAGVATDGGLVYVADTGDNEVREISPGGTIELVAGNGTRCTTAPSCGDDGPPANAELSSPSGLAFNRSGTELYIADTVDQEVRKVALPTNTITTVAGNSMRCAQPPACGDGGDPTSAALNVPGAVAIDSAGNVYIADTQDHEIRRAG